MSQNRQTLSDAELLRYSRQIMLPEIDTMGQLQLASARVLIVGLGGLGSPLAIYLCCAGVGTLVLADCDQVDLSNLQRQILHGEADIGCAKTSSATRHLAALNSTTRITVVTRSLEDDAFLLEQVRGVDIVADASDSFRTRFAINAACFATTTPLVSAAAIRFEGQISVFDPRIPHSPCYRCLYDESGGVDERCTSNGVLAPLLGILGSMQASEVIKLRMGIGTPLLGRLLCIDALHMRFQEVKLEQDPVCPVCASR